ncbi:hypothetical protein [Streptomyces sp. NPDC005423]|uniref:hypothetical protein n=1 Tax=Streptomyces sp. NPDC005423 TaxID=3155343 RepID=UPI0033B57FF8
MPAADVRQAVGDPDRTGVAVGGEAGPRIRAAARHCVLAVRPLLRTGGRVARTAGSARAPAPVRHS